MSRGEAERFSVITAKNLFHPSRSSVRKTSLTKKIHSDNELPQLYGTIIMGDRNFAILEDMSTKKSKLYKVNDSVSGYIISKIMEKKVVLQKNGEAIEIGLRADKEFKKPGRSKRARRAIRKVRRRKTSSGRIRKKRSMPGRSSVKNSRR